MSPLRRSLAPPLSLTDGDVLPGRWGSDRRLRPDPALNPLPAVALIISIFAVWIGWTVGYVAGSQAKENSQLGQALSLMVRAPTLDSALAESRVTMRRLDTLAAKATRRPRQPPAPIRTVPLGRPASGIGPERFPALQARTDSTP